VIVCTLGGDLDKDTCSAWWPCQAFLQSELLLGWCVAAVWCVGALTAALNWYRANTQARHFGQTRPWPVMRQSRIACPVLGVWSSQDTALLEAQMTRSADYVAPGCWQYVRLGGVSHWIPRDAPQQLDKLLLRFLRGEQVDGAVTSQSSADARHVLSKL
jgi:pimeloyl-ACP methyl ester carboxylesterase